MCGTFGTQHPDGRRAWQRRCPSSGCRCAQIAVSVSANLVIIAIAGTLSAFLTTRPAWLRVQRYVTGSALGVLALLLATHRSHPGPPR